MQVTTKAFVFSGIKYSESSLILNAYTQNNGKQSFFYRGFYKKKNRLKALLFPLVQVELTYKNSNNNLKMLYNAKLVEANLWESNPIKNTVNIFLAEVLNQVLREEEENQKLYNFLKDSFLWFRLQEKHFGNFHLWFLLHLSKFLGFYPNMDQKDANYFDLIQGQFTNQIKSVEYLDQSDSKIFKELCNYNLESASKSINNQQERQKLLFWLLKYYSIHIPDFKTPNSLAVLTKIFQ